VECRPVQETQENKKAPNDTRSHCAAPEPLAKANRLPGLHGKQTDAPADAPASDWRRPPANDERFVASTAAHTGANAARFTRIFVADGTPTGAVVGSVLAPKPPIKSTELATRTAEWPATMPTVVHDESGARTPPAAATSSECAANSGWSK
jgi:hypothetical protein